MQADNAGAAEEELVSSGAYGLPFLCKILAKAPL